MRKFASCKEPPAVAGRPTAPIARAGPKACTRESVCITFLAAITDTHSVSRALNCLSHALPLATADLAMARIRGRQAQG
jgi:hypothetical protein